MALNNLQRLICHKTNQPTNPQLSEQRLYNIVPGVSRNVITNGFSQQNLNSGSVYYQMVLCHSKLGLIDNKNSVSFSRFVGHFRDLSEKIIRSVLKPLLFLLVWKKTLSNNYFENDLNPKHLKLKEIQWEESFVFIAIYWRISITNYSNLVKFLLHEDTITNFHV